ncbi:hypothetical protein KUQ60_002418 [Salmonella enterica]|nr:hypothetical protein [Salmonella enterica]EHF8619531.1 hypothetical protein [Salmonella enterica]EHR7544569.1 hypothetical protein [Salmonella enterica]EIU6094694.1 hypothetical protein [Salmonella enterica]
MKPSYEELEAKCLALAAENVGLKASIPQQRNVEFDNDSMDDISLAEDVGFNDAIERMKINMSKTPSTSAFLAEVRAAAVDDVCLKISNAIVNCYQDEQVGLDAAATICGDFAAQLRKGVQS